MEQGLKLTTHGRAVLAACMGLSAPLELTRTAVGSGRVSESTDLADVHELVNFVENATIAERRHEGDRLYLNVQYTNKKTAKAFLLSEFMIYAKDPETGQETDFIYATLGGYPESIPAYSPAYPLGIWNHRIIVVVSSEINVSVSAAPGIVTHNDLDNVMRLAMQSLRDMLGFIVRAEKMDLTIPASGWVPDSQYSDYPYKVDIPDGRITEDMVPQLTILPPFLGIAGKCGMCPSVETIPGGLRVYAKSVPDAAMEASLTLLGDVQTEGVVTIPTIGWVPDEDTKGAYPLHIDIGNAYAKEDLAPMLTILPDSLKAAGACGMSTAAQTFDGLLRVYAKAAPATPIKASLSLLGVSPYDGKIGGIAASLPVATASNVGGIKASDSIVIDADGTAHARLGEDSFASPEEVEAAINDVFGEQP